MPAITFEDGTRVMERVLICLHEGCPARIRLSITTDTDGPTFQDVISAFSLLSGGMGWRGGRCRKHRLEEP